MHFAVALAWAAVFLLLATNVAWIRRVLDSPFGVVKVAFVLGPLIWIEMSCVVIPLLVKRPPNITVTWWIQLIGHAPFVGLPIVWWIGRRERAEYS